MREVTWASSSPCCKKYPIWEMIFSVDEQVFLLSSCRHRILVNSQYNNLPSNLIRWSLKLLSSWHCSLPLTDVPLLFKNPQRHPLGWEPLAHRAICRLSVGLCQVKCFYFRLLYILSVKLCRNVRCQHVHMPPDTASYVTYWKSTLVKMSAHLMWRNRRDIFFFSFSKVWK